VRKRSETKPTAAAKAKRVTVAPSQSKKAASPSTANVEAPPAAASHISVAEPKSFALDDNNPAVLIDDKTDPTYGELHELIFGDLQKVGEEFRRPVAAFDRFLSRRSETIIQEAATKLIARGQPEIVYSALKEQLTTFVTVREKAAQKAQRIHDAHLDLFTLSIPEQQARARKPDSPQLAINTIQALDEQVLNRAEKFAHMVLGVEHPWADKLAVEPDKLLNAMTGFASGDSNSRLIIECAMRRLGIKIEIAKRNPEGAVTPSKFLHDKYGIGRSGTTAESSEPNASWIGTKVLTLPNLRDEISQDVRQSSQILNRWRNRVHRAEQRKKIERVLIPDQDGHFYFISDLVRILRTDVNLFTPAKLELLAKKFGSDAIK
jgi:hypothetical protein